MNVIGNVATMNRATAPNGAVGGDRLVVVDGKPAETLLIVQMLTVVRRRKWLILGVVTAALIIGLLVTLLMTPKYTAQATIEIQRETRNFTMVKGAETEETSGIDLEFYQTQYGLLQSRSLAERVATGLRLFDNPDFFAMFGVGDAADWFENGRPRRDAPPRDQRIRAAGEVLLDNFGVIPERASRLVRLQFTSPDPAFSQRVVNAWGTNFIESTMERRYEATAYARQFLENRLGQLRARIDETERQLVDYAARQGIVNLPSAAASGVAGGTTTERSLAADDLASLNRELSDATADRVTAQSRLAAGGDTVNEALTNTAISGLRQRRAELAAEYARMMVQFEPAYPPARAIQEQVEQLDRAISREESRVRQTLRETYEAALAREQSLRANVESLKGSVLDLRRRSIQYNIYQRDVDTSRQLYDALLQRYKEIGVAGGVSVNNISIVDMSPLPEEPSSPKFLLNILASLLAGSLLGLAIAFALEQIDQGVSDPADVEKALGVPLLGTVPTTVDEEPSIALEDQKSVIAEAYTSLRTRLSFSTDHGFPRTLAITSTRAGEGKTTTSYALALSMARSKKRVVLVDGDLRSPSVHHLFDMDPRNGLSNYLAGASELPEVIRPTKFEGLFVITAGPQPPSAPELLSSERFDHLLRDLAGAFDHVIIDAPPVMGLADAPLIASRMEGVALVIEMQRTQRGMAKVALERLFAANAQIMGAVLTKFDVKRAHYGYGYDYGYGYGYGSPTAA